MAIFKKFFLILGIFIYIFIGLTLKILLLIIYPDIRFRIISYWTRVFNRFLRLILNIRVILEGDYFCLKEKGNFVISNHLGYLDGIILGSLIPVIYVSKSEVRSWPLFGWITIVGETIFIDRQRKNKSTDYIQETSSMLKRRVNVLIFPEGTSTNGERLLHFQSIHFQSALNAKCPILPVTISYTKINEEKISQANRDRVCWYGQIKFYEHLLSLLELKNIEAKVVIHPKIYLHDSANLNYSRKSLSEALYNVISHNYPLFQNYSPSPY